ncbi:MAG: FAD:protein FMN transferase [Pseudomonadota bacterium]
MRITAITLPLLILLCLYGCSDARHPVRLHGKTMGTTWSLTVTSPPDEVRPRQLQQQIETLLETINALMSSWRADSEISRFNASSSTGWFAVSPQTYALLQAASRIHRLSEGAFDPTVSPLVELWGFGHSLPEQGLPDASRISSALQHTGMEKLLLDDKTERMRKTLPLLQLDLSAIAKGYAVDEVARLLERQGIQDYLVEIGGEIRVAGANPDGKAWRVAVEYPHIEQLRSAAEILGLSDAAVATSGDYRNFTEIDGKRYSHIIDPATGMPVTHNPASVTVIAADCLTADAWATAFTVLGADKGVRLADSMRMAVMFLYREKGRLKTISSHKMLNYLENKPSETPLAESGAE